ncbi:MAG: hypothetical protein AUJ98_02415 [Bacteroidetes bacterium CG2_30_33_31]|nr:MAG: hypothetical protein AUJ98_02415 [Bacteroidetes bacterium CG2_30_33_31]
MLKNIDFKKIMPDAAAVLVFLLITFFFFNPLFDGKQMKQSDIKNHIGMSKEIADYRDSHKGEEPLWTNSMFGGMPAYQISVAYSSNLLQYIDTKIIRLSLPRPADYFFVYMLGFFILMRVLKIDPWLSLIGAVAFAFSSYFLIILEAGHNSKALAIGYMAPTLAFLILTYRGKYLAGGILSALFLGLEIYANHPQITYYLGLIILIIGIAELVKSIKNKTLPNFLKATGILVIALILAVGANIGNLLTTMEYTPYTIRGKAELSFDKNHKSSSGLDKDYATQWSYGKAETFSLLIPNAKGGASGYLGEYKEAIAKVDPNLQSTVAQQNVYWGDQPFTSGPVYIGAILVFLFIFSIFIVKSELKWILLIATLLSIFLSWGKNMMWFTDFFLDYIPAYNKFRAVSMILVIAELTMVMLAFLGLSEILKRPEIIKEQKKNFFIAFGLTGGLSLLFYLMPSVFFNFLSQAEVSQFDSLQSSDPANAVNYQMVFDAMQQVRKSVFTADAMRSFIFILLGAALLWVYSMKKIPKAAFLAILGILMVVDIIPVDSRYLSDKNYEREKTVQTPFIPTNADLQILNDKDPNYRVLNLAVNPFQDASTSYYHKSIGGYHGAKFRRYQDLIDFHIGKFNMEVINMLNTKYIIQKGQDGQPIAQPNYATLGNAWFINNIKWAKNADQEISSLGKIIRIESLSPKSEFQIYGRNLNAVDTMMLTAPIEIISAIDQSTVEKIELSRYNLQAGHTYIFGVNAKDSTADFINLTEIKNPQLIAAKQFRVQVISSFDARNDVVIGNDFKNIVGDFAIQKDSNASIKLISYEPNDLKYESNTQKVGLAVFSEIYYPKGWKAYIDGKESKYFRTNYILRGMLIPAGKHQVEFKFHPESYFIGKKISLASSSVIILLLAFMLFQFLMPKKKVSPKD